MSLKGELSTEYFLTLEKLKILKRRALGLFCKRVIWVKSAEFQCSIKRLHNNWLFMRIRSLPGKK